jgi:hypothetical protein
VRPAFVCRNSTTDSGMATASCPRKACSSCAGRPQTPLGAGSVCRCPGCSKVRSCPAESRRTTGPVLREVPSGGPNFGHGKGRLESLGSSRQLFGEPHAEKAKGVLVWDASCGRARRRFRRRTPNHLGRTRRDVRRPRTFIEASCCSAKRCCRSRT